MGKFLNEFKAFAVKGNAVDMAVGVIIGGAFSGIVTSLTDNFINPILSMITQGARYTMTDIGGFAAVETLALVENAAAHGIAFYVVVVAIYHGVLFFELFG